MVGDGWIKDGDYNTVFSKTVLPLPYHAIKDYTKSPGRLENDPRYSDANVRLTNRPQLISEIEETLGDENEEEARLGPLGGDEDEVETKRFTVVGHVEEETLVLATRRSPTDDRA